MMTNQPPFLETVSPPIRKALVSQRIAAMSGRLAESENELRALLGNPSTSKSEDLVAVASLLAEMLYLDGRTQDSFDVYREFIEPRQGTLPVDAQLVLTENLATLQMDMSSSAAAATFYNLVDRRRIAQFRASDTDALFQAQGAIENETYTDALSPLWQNLLRAHTLGSWSASRRAAEQLGRLHLKMGAMAEACHYLILAGAESHMDGLALAMDRRGDSDLMRAMLSHLITYSNLRRHFNVACKLLTRVSDLVPDDLVEPLAEWLLCRCRETPAVDGGRALRAAWEVIRKLGSRIPQAASQKLIEAALSHPSWLAPPPQTNRVNLDRKVMVEAVDTLVGATPPQVLSTVVDATLPLAISRVQDYDYGSVVNLLCRLAELGGEALRDKIKNSLYASEKRNSRILAQVAEFFGVEALTVEQWDAFAHKVMDEMQLTVQLVNFGDAPKPVPETVATLKQKKLSGELYVMEYGGVGLEALARGRHHLSDATVGKLIRVLVEMVLNAENIPTNRAMLLAQLCQFSDRADDTLKSEVVRAIEPLARGAVPQSTESPESSAGQLPSAFFRMAMGSHEQVRAVALVAAATFCGGDQACVELVSDAIFEGFVHPHVSVRRGAYRAARRLPDLSGERMLPLLMGLRDADPSASVAAFSAIAERTDWGLNEPMWRLFLLASRLANQQPQASLRRHVAFAVRVRLDQAPTKSLRDEAVAILRSLASDVAYSVREAVGGRSMGWSKSETGSPCG